LSSGAAEEKKFGHGGKKRGDVQNSFKIRPRSRMTKTKLGTPTAHCREGRKRKGRGIKPPAGRGLIGEKGPERRGGHLSWSFSSEGGKIPPGPEGRKLQGGRLGSGGLPDEKKRKRKGYAVEPRPSKQRGKKKRPWGGVGITHFVAYLQRPKKKKKRGRKGKGRESRFSIRKEGKKPRTKERGGAMACCP